MDSSDPKPSSTVFDLPPQETETHAAREADDKASILAGKMDMPEVPKAALSEAAKELFPGPEEPAPEAADDTPLPAKPSPGPTPTNDADKKSPGAAQSAATVTTEPAPVELRGEPDKAAQLGLGPWESSSVLSGSRHANLRRTLHFGKLMAVTFLANLLVLVGVVFWLQRRGSEEDASAGLTSPAASMNPASAGADALEKRLAALEKQSQAQTAQIEALAAAASSAKAPSPAGAVTPSAANVPSVQNELVLLKERNRLTGYADEAIATGARAPYDRLWEALDDPRRANLVHAARAEILRVQNYYLGGSRIDQFDIPVATYFPEDAALRDSQLKDSQLIKLLRDQKNPWQVRLKAANLLTTRRSLEVGDALVEAVKHDENLDVVKEATFSFEAMTGFHAKIFDAGSLEQWWKKYKATPAPSKSGMPKAKTREPKAKGEATNPQPPPEGKNDEKKS